MKTSSALTESIIGFSDILRRKGFVISSAEIGDAIFLLGSVGFLDRETVKSTLCSIFASGQRQILIFNEEFDQYFVGKTVLLERSQQQEEAENARVQRINYAKEELREYELPEEIAEAYSEVDEKKQQWLKDMVERVKSSPRHLPLAEDYIKKIATGWLVGEGGQGLEGKSDEPEDLLNKSLISITEDEAPRALSLIEALVRRINGAEDRKYRRSGRNGVPDLRATIHDSMKTGGIPLHPRYKKRRRSQKRYVILCDVSESMYRFSGFALRFITALGNSSNRTEAYIFSEGALEINLADLRNFETNVKKSPLWRKGTDLGGAIGTLLGKGALSSQSILIILSDGKTINLPFATDNLQQASKVCRSVLWLNPDRNPSPTTDALGEHCMQLGCATLEDLAEACTTVSQI